ncbi:unnamed protein product [Paramecium octaurelia]|uniref:Costars domain-containing protein n=1 Tax=Paramecium octaurelia TaxID=43137 RepID=A0A8S1WCM5_PAROT|nr:unnamed protein product [Paramecium octaurelia]
MQEKIQEEIEELKKDIQRLGTKNAEGKYVVKFGVLFNDEKTQQYYEQNVLDFQGQMLLKGAHDNVDIILK